MPKNGKFDFSSDLTEAMQTAHVSREKGVIEGVVILTGDKVSKNKTLYTKKALAEAVRRYDGAKMFIDHPKEGETVRSVRDFGGVYKNLRIEEGQRLKADLHLVPNQAIRDIVFPIAESAPAGVALSIRDHGHGKEENGVFLVEGFAPKGAFAIELVTEASVNDTLFESHQGGEDDMDLSKVTLAELVAGNPTLVESIKTTERQAVTKELEEQIKAGKEAPGILARAKKLMALTDSGLPKEVIEKIKPVVESEHTSPEATEALIKAQKEIVEALKKPTKGKADPTVTGHGAGAADDTNLGEAVLPSSDELARALQG